MTQTVEVLCARCRVPLKGPAEPDSDARFACPSCGEGDTHEAVMREVGEYVQEMAAKNLSESLANAARSSTFLKVTSKYTPSGRQWRFIANVDL